MAPTADAAVVERAANETPYQLDQAQVLKASSALLKHINSEAKRKEQASGKKNLLVAGDSSPDEEDHLAEPIWLQITTKKHIVDKKRLKPGKILLPHTLNKSASASICLITSDPQRAFKDVLAHPTFSRSLEKQIRIIGISKIKARYKSFESRRQLLSEYDVFLADDRIVSLLPRLLGKTIFESSKRPVPVRLEGYKPKDINGKRTKGEKGSDSKAIAEPKLFTKEIEKALSSARVHLSPSVTTSVRVGFSNFPAQEIAENVEAVVAGMVEKFITKGWRNIRTIHVKGPNTAALPIWMSDKLWVDDEDILEDDEAAKAKLLGTQKGTKRKGRDLEKPAHDGDDPRTKKKRLEEAGFSKEMAERRQKLRQQKEEAREEAGNALAADIEIPLISGPDKKNKGQGTE